MPFFLKMAINVMNTPPSMITLPPTSLIWSHHTQQSRPFLEPLPLSRSRNIASPFGSKTTTIRNIKLSSETVFHPSNQRRRQIQSIGINRRWFRPITYALVPPESEVLMSIELSSKFWLFRHSIIVHPPTQPLP